MLFPAFGYNDQGQICTFRGGSDITGAIIARGVHAKRYENFTDVDAIYAANPPGCPPSDCHSQYDVPRNAGTFLRWVFSFHDEALIPAIQGDIQVVVKNTNHPSERGTSITSHKRVNPAYPVSKELPAHQIFAVFISESIC